MATKRCPETPRQKMIGMMYLFLMAMLALNVSSEVLVGFRLVDDSVRISIASTQERIEERYHHFDMRLEQESEHYRLAIMHTRAQELRAASDSLYNYIQNFKVAIVRLGDGRRRYDPNAIEIRNPQNLSAAAQYALTFGNGEILRNKLVEHRDLLIRLADDDPQKQAMYTALFDVSDRPNRDGVMQRWEQAMFDNMPLGAAVAILTKIQNDVRIAELDLVQFLERQVDAADIRVDTFLPFVIPSARHLVQGEEFTLRVGLAAMNSENLPRFYYDSARTRPMPTREGGQLGFHSVNAPVGRHTVSGYVFWQEEIGGETRRHRFDETFIVGAPVATISNVDLNVMYRGIDNRFSVAVSGVPAADVRVTAQGANVRQSGLHWIINPTQNEDVRVMITAAGRTTTETFRVMQLPTPSAFLRYRDAGGVIREVSDARLSLATLRSPDLRVVAGYGAGSLLQADFEVVNFSVTTIAGNVRAEGNRLTPRQLQDIERLDRGAQITIREIDARGPDGTIRRLNTLNIILN